MNELDCSSILRGSLLTDNALQFLAYVHIPDGTLSDTRTFWFYDTIVSAAFIQIAASRKGAGRSTRVPSVRKAQVWSDLDRGSKEYRRLLIPLFLGPEMLGRNATEAGHWILAVVENYDSVKKTRNMADGNGNGSQPTCFIYDSCLATRSMSNELAFDAVNRLLCHTLAQATYNGLQHAVVEFQQEQTDGESCGYFLINSALSVLRGVPAALTVDDVKMRGSFMCKVYTEKEVAPNLWAWMQQEMKSSYSNDCGVKYARAQKQCMGPAESSATTKAGEKKERKSRKKGPQVEQATATAPVRLRQAKANIQVEDGSEEVAESEKNDERWKSSATTANDASKQRAKS
jgi:hypothetical protein